MTRGEAAQACIDRFGGKAFDPKSRRDCVRLAAHALHCQGVGCAPLKGARYTTLEGGLKALKKLGFEDLIEAVDSLPGLTRIAGARAIAGDIVAMPCDDGPWGCALAVSVGNGRVFGFCEGVGQVVIPSQILCAWRVQPCRK